MALSYRARRLWSVVILIFALPIYIAVAWYLLSLFERPSIWIELGIYVVLGIVWALPFKAVFRGVGKADPDAPPEP